MQAGGGRPKLLIVLLEFVTGRFSLLLVPYSSNWTWDCTVHSSRVHCVHVTILYTVQCALYCTLLNSVYFTVLLSVQKYQLCIV